MYFTKFVFPIFSIFFGVQKWESNEKQTVLHNKTQ